jgi:hypothetical protein
MQLKQKISKQKKVFNFYTSYELRVFNAILYILMSVIGDNFLNIILVLIHSCSILDSCFILVICDKKEAYYFSSFCLIFNDVFAAIGTYFIKMMFLTPLIEYCILLRFI